MKTSDFWFDLPPERIAQFPPEERGASRLFLLDRNTGKREHRMVSSLPDILAERLGSRPLFVFNNSRVRKARLPGRSRVTGAAAEFLLVNRVDPHTWRVLVEKAKRKKPGSRYVFSDGLEGEIVEYADDENSTAFRYLRFDTPIDDIWLDRHGRIPLPPYITRPCRAADDERYQTVYADRHAGAALEPGASAAAPTAGLHFTEEMLERLEKAGVETAFITLHVGLGTFLPLRAEHIESHVMHEEVYCIDEEAARRINRAKAEGRTIVAVGTTSLRTLESAADLQNKLQTIKQPPSLAAGMVAAGEGATSLFIVPGYRFKIADAIFTNFHTPYSTLLVLVSAFAGRELILDSYAEAIREGYRFFSYGDAMLIY
jgi:S-adenosylmethionine:tRNA ribosyltransferase-isomerase